MFCSKIKAFLFCSLLFCQFAKAQAYNPMLSDSNTWYITTCFEGCWTDVVWTSGDTTLGGLQYKIVRSKRCNSTSPCIIAFFREDTLQKKVYVRKYSQDVGFKDTTEFVYYDFSLVQGDSIYLFDPQILYPRDVRDTLGWYRVDTVYSISTLVGIRKLLFLYPVNFIGCCENMNWVESIGAIDGPYLYGGGDSWLNCFFRNEVHEYSSWYGEDTVCDFTNVGINEVFPSQNFSVFPNPTNNFTTLLVKDKETMLTASLFDVAGREVLPLFTNKRLSTFNFPTEGLPPGLYFVKITNEAGRAIPLKLVKQ
ncbi:MAG: hypothetical protein JWO06_3855 [Bacteroidota bacterium]|nr:hypothetical protein [Bacteroidota bacterium]